MKKVYFIVYVVIVAALHLNKNLNFYNLFTISIYLNFLLILPIFFYSYISTGKQIVQLTISTVLLLDELI